MNLLLLGLGFLRRAGRTRAVITVGCTAAVSGLLLVAVTVVLYGNDAPTRVALPDGSVMVTWSEARDNVANLLADGGVRPGYAFALVLICLVPLTLLQQAVRLGTASRERRLAGLRLAGATPRQVRTLAAVETGLPAAVGGFSAGRCTWSCATSSAVPVPRGGAVILRSCVSCVWCRRPLLRPGGRCC